MNIKEIPDIVLIYPDEFINDEIKDFTNEKLNLKVEKDAFMAFE